MNIIKFQKLMSPYPVMSLQDIKKNIPSFSFSQLYRWEKQGYICKIRRGFYRLTVQESDRSLLFFAANKIYPPSYISLEKALKFYQFIPEEVFQVTSVSTKKNTNFKTPIGNFIYQHLKPSLFWGYQVLDFSTSSSLDSHVLIAMPEKAILDYLYLNPHLRTPEDFLEMRINTETFFQAINPKKFHKFLREFHCHALTKRAEIFLKTLSND